MTSAIDALKLDAPKLDTLDMFGIHIKGDAQLKSGAESARGVAAGLGEKNIQLQNIVYVGMGGSGIVGDLANAVVKPEVPFVIAKSYDLPDFVDENTLVVAVSFSGNTAETLDCVKSALSKSAQVVGVTTGGELLEMGSRKSFPVVKLDVSIPMPRAGLMPMAAAVLTILGEVGFYPNAPKALKQAESHVASRIAQLAGENSPARQMAKDLLGTSPIFVGGAGIGAVAARRWKAQINENAKTPAFFSELPEAAHNELVGWGLNGDITRQIFSLVHLRSDYEAELLDGVFSATLEMQREVMRGCYEVRAKGNDILSQILDLVLFGDFMSLHLADLLGIDPGPIPAIAELKEKLHR